MSCLAAPAQLRRYALQAAVQEPSLFSSVAPSSPNASRNASAVAVSAAVRMLRDPSPSAPPPPLSSMPLPSLDELIDDSCCWPPLVSACRACASSAAFKHACAAAVTSSALTCARSDASAAAWTPAADAAPSSSSPSPAEEPLESSGAKERLLPRERRRPPDDAPGDRGVAAARSASATARAVSACMLRAASVVARDRSGVRSTLLLRRAFAAASTLDRRARAAAASTNHCPYASISTMPGRHASAPPAFCRARARSPATVRVAARAASRSKRPAIRLDRDLRRNGAAAKGAATRPAITSTAAMAAGMAGDKLLSTGIGVGTTGGSSGPSAASIAEGSTRKLSTRSSKLSDRAAAGAADGDGEGAAEPCSMRICLCRRSLPAPPVEAAFATIAAAASAVLSAAILGGSSKAAPVQEVPTFTRGSKKACTVTKVPLAPCGGRANASTSASPVQPCTTAPGRAEACSAGETKPSDPSVAPSRVEPVLLPPPPPRVSRASSSADDAARDDSSTSGGDCRVCRRTSPREPAPAASVMPLAHTAACSVRMADAASRAEGQAASGHTATKSDVSATTTG